MALKFPLIKAKELSELHTSLYYLRMSELKALSKRLHLPTDGQKGALIHRIYHYVRTGTITKLPEIPDISKTKTKQRTPLTINSLMLFGSYKNDLATRNFMKTIVGPHFHFTAYGIDWLNERWLSGNPPTYKEFAVYWQEETDRRKNRKPIPKKEWAYISFVQKLIHETPNAGRQLIINEWMNMQKYQTEKVYKILNKFLK